MSNPTNVASFNVDKDAGILRDSMIKKVKKYATRRIQKSAVFDFIGETDLRTGTVRHSQIALGDRLGQGSFSSVFAVKSLRLSNGEESKDEDANKLVVKFLRPKLIANPPMFAACAADLVKEGMILGTLNHENIITARALQADGLAGYSSGRHDAFFLVLERLEETLGEKIEYWKAEEKVFSFNFSQRAARKTMLLKERADVILQISSAVDYLHSKNLLHRDLKPENIGFADGVVKLFDFDVSRIVPQSENPDETFKFTKRCGSPRYMSPECAKGECYNLKADVYSFSLLCHELLTLSKPFDELPTGCHDEMVFEDGVRPRIPVAWPKSLGQLLERGWSDDIPERPTMSEVHGHLSQLLTSMVAEKEAQQTRTPFGFLKRNTRTVPVAPSA